MGEKASGLSEREGIVLSIPLHPKESTEGKKPKRGQLGRGRIWKGGKEAVKRAPETKEEED